MPNKPHQRTISSDSADTPSRNPRPAAMGRRRSLLIAIALLSLITVVAIWFWPFTKKASVEEEPDIVVSVKVAKAERESIDAEVTVPGTISARQEATVSPKIAGQIKQMALLRNKA